MTEARSVHEADNVAELSIRQHAVEILAAIWTDHEARAQGGDGDGGAGLDDALRFLGPVTVRTTSEDVNRLVMDLVLGFSAAFIDVGEALIDAVPVADVAEILSETAARLSLVEDSLQ
jgi:hypothetical protein